MKQFIKDYFDWLLVFIGGWVFFYEDEAIASFFCFVCCFILNRIREIKTGNSTGRFTIKGTDLTHFKSRDDNKRL